MGLILWRIVIMDVAHMDFNASHELANKLISAQNQIAELVVSTVSSVDQYVGSQWISSSAEQFLSEIQEWGNQQRQSLDRLNDIIAHLENEINRMQQEAQSM